MNSIYISRSNDVPSRLCTELKQLIHNELPNTTVSHWKRGGKYTLDKLLSSNIVVVLLKDFKAVIGKGVHIEIMTAIKLNISVIIAYKRKTDNTMQLYAYSGVDYSHNFYVDGSYSSYCTVIFGNNITVPFFSRYLYAPTQREIIKLDCLDERVIIARRSLSLSAIKGKVREDKKSKLNLILTPVIGRTR